MRDDAAREVIRTRSEAEAERSVERRLESEPLDPTEAHRIVSRGSEVERVQLAGNTHGLPLDVLWILVNDRSDHVAKSALDNMALPSELLIVLADRFTGESSVIDAIARHPRAPFAMKLSRPVGTLSGTSISMFLEDVQSSSDERARFSELVRRHPDRTLRELWSHVRELDQ